MKGWFDAFRDDGGPTLYSFSNRTPVTGDVSIVAVSVLFATFYVAFLVIFPGVRKQKFTTFSTVTLSLFVGLVILITRLGSAWHVAHATIIAPYKAFSREKLPARIGTHIGLMHVNVTLTDQQFKKKNHEQYLNQMQFQTRRKMFAALRTVKHLRELGKIEEMSAYIEDFMENIVMLKTSRIMPWKFEFIREIYNIVALAHADCYVLPLKAPFKLDSLTNLRQLLKVRKSEQLSPVKYEFGNRSTYVSPDVVDPKHEKLKKWIARLKKRLIFSEFSTEKCYLLYEKARAYLNMNRYHQCISLAKRAMEESKKCRSSIWSFLNAMLMAKAYIFLHQVEYYHVALQEAFNLAIQLDDPSIKAFIQLALSIVEDQVLRKNSSGFSVVRRKMSKSGSITRSVEGE